MEMSVRQFQEQIAEALAAVERGERVVITRDGVAVAIVEPPETEPRFTPGEQSSMTEAERVASFKQRIERARTLAGLDKKPLDFPLDEEWRKNFDDPAWGRSLFGLDTDDEASKP